MDYINFDRPKLERFKAARDAAIQTDKQVFMFEDREVLVTYAKYMIEYLEQRLAH